MSISFSLFAMDLGAILKFAVTAAPALRPSASFIRSTALAKSRNPGSPGSVPLRTSIADGDRSVTAEGCGSGTPALWR